MGAYSTHVESGRQRGSQSYAGGAAPKGGGKSFEASRATNKHLLDGLMTEFRHTGPALQFRDPAADAHREGRAGAAGAIRSTVTGGRSPPLGSSPQRRRG